jgi:D-amino-acid dehydrogenase
MTRSVLILGAGMVGVSVGLHLRRRGYDVVVLDRQAPGEGASFGNGGLIQREAVFPTPFPRQWRDLLRYAGNGTREVHYHPSALPGLALPLLRYWWNSAPGRYAALSLGQAALVVTCIDEHRALAQAAGPAAEALLRPLGWLRLFAEEAGFATALAKAEQARAEYGVGFRALDAAGLAAAEPHLQITRPHALHWTDPLSVSDPHALVLAYAALLAREGGRFVRGDAMTLARHGPGWRVTTEAGPLAAEEVVVALGAHAAALTRRFGYAPPLFGKRGYHKHYAMRGNAVLHHPVIDTPAGFALMPMRAGVRLTTGIEFAALDAPATPVQLTRAEPVARAMLPLGEAREATPWMGVRPCLPDMLPVIGPLPGMPGAWGAFGHAHQGFTLGPSTGRLLAEMMAGEAPFVPPGPYRAERF